ncbi:hypothetical protein [Pyrobaculum aerophilum]|uniref:hypothetical protein n=1 Tax=Pyrobaculum aerophilum TaxID=13773 RepID=UPI002FDB00B6
MEPAALAWITAGFAVPAILVVYAFLGIDRRWAVAAGLVSVLILLILFAYTSSIIMALYSAVSWPPDPALVEKGVAYQRVAAGQLAAASFIIGMLAVGYYMEISKREGHE